MGKWGNKVKNICTPKLAAIVLALFYFVSLIPLLIISWYNYPSADDYTNGSGTYHIWKASHSVVKVFGEAVRRAGEEWIEWRGCFTSSFLSAIPPNIWGEKFYPITTWIVLAMLSVSTIYFFHAILVKIFGADRYTCFSIAMLVLLVSVNCIPEQSRVEAFYWYSGAINYTFMHSVALLFYGLLISIVFDRGRKRTISVVVASIAGFLAAGGNQMIMLNIAIVLAVVVIFITLCKKWKSYKILGIPIGIFCIGFVLAVIAPGNFVRAAESNGMSPIKAIFVSFYDCLDLALSQWIAWPIIAVILAMIPLFWHMTGKVNFQFSYPLIVVAFGYGLVSAMITPPLFAVGNVEAGRLQAQVYLVYVIVFTLCVGYVTGWVRKQFEKYLKWPAQEENNYGLKECTWFLACLVFLIFGSVITIIPEPHYYTCSSAWADLSNGSARAYGSALDERVKVYQKGGEGTVKVEKLSVQPSVLYFSDITEDEQDWTNRGIARFYDLDSVVIENNE